MSPIKTLSNLLPGVPAEIYRLDTQGSMRRRLMDIGFSPGSTVEALFCSCTGDPVAYYVHGTVIALRRDDAATVLVSEL